MAVCTLTFFVTEPDRREEDSSSRSLPQMAEEREDDSMVYPTRYQAEKHRIKGEEVVVHVYGGYVIMSYSDYQIWRKQK